MPTNRTRKQTELIQKVWNKGKIIKGKDPNKYRLDTYGNVIFFGSYGKYTKMGWHKEHGKPKCVGGTDHLNNLRPVQAKENLKKGCTYPYKKKRKTKKQESSNGGWGLVAAIALGLITLGALK